MRHWKDEGNFVSGYLRENFRAAKVLCEANQNFTACQLLGNLCVMLMYNEDRAATDACKEYLKIVRGYKFDFVSGITDWPSTMPWLYYKADSSIEVLQKTNIAQTFSRGEKTKYNLVSYTGDGIFAGIKTDPTVLQLCPSQQAISQNAFLLTAPYTVTCRLSADRLLAMDSLFFDMYLVLGDNEESQYPVPVLVDNVQERGTYVNRDTDQTKWKLNRRFFLVDKYSGLRVSGDSIPKFVQYAASVELAYRLREDGLFYPPLLKVKYDELTLDEENLATQQVDLSFKVTYEMDTSQIEEAVKVSYTFF